MTAEAPNSKAEEAHIADVPRQVRRGGVSHLVMGKDDVARMAQDWHGFGEANTQATDGATL